MGGSYHTGQNQWLKCSSEPNTLLTLRMSVNLSSAYFYGTGRNSLWLAFVNKLQMDCYLSVNWRCSDSKLKLFLIFLLNSPQKVLANGRRAFYWFWSNTQYVWYITLRNILPYSQLHHTIQQMVKKSSDP